MVTDVGSVPMDEPLAYFLTWTTYGSWLPGDARGWVERPGCFRPPDPKREEAARQRMTESALTLDTEQRKIVEKTIADHCRVRGWHLHVAKCRTQHVHVVVTAPNRDPDNVMDQFKAWCTRRLKEHLRSKLKAQTKNLKPDAQAKPLKPDAQAKPLKPDAQAKPLKPDAQAKESQRPPFAPSLKPDAPAKESQQPPFAPSLKPDAQAKESQQPSFAGASGSNASANGLKPDAPAKVREKWWTQKGSKRRLYDQASLEAAIRYVVEDQDAPRGEPEQEKKGK